jgi:hypothetical protein
MTQLSVEVLWGLVTGRRLLGVGFSMLRVADLLFENVFLDLVGVVVLDVLESGSDDLVGLFLLVFDRIFGVFLLFDEILLGESEVFLGRSVPLLVVFGLLFLLKLEGSEGLPAF